MSNSTSISEDFHRKHGLSPPLDSRQMFAMFLAAAPIVTFFIFIHPCTMINHSYFFTIPFCIFYFIALLLFVFCTLETHPYPALITPEQSHYCKYCCEIVPNSSKHCKSCNKCRVGFDHHCRFINNCVSNSNYQCFYYGILMFITAAILSIVASIFIYIGFKKDEKRCMDKLSKYLTINVSKTGFFVILGITIIIDLALLIPLVILVFYHIIFQVNNITTYDYILHAYENYPQEMERFVCMPGKNNRIVSYRNTD